MEPLLDDFFDGYYGAAAHLMEAQDTDVVFENGNFSVAGTDKSVPFASVTRIW